MTKSGSRAQRKLQRARMLEASRSGSRQAEVLKSGGSAGIGSSNPAADPQAPAATSTTDPDFPDSTEAPGSEFLTYRLPADLDATEAPEIGVPEETQGELAESVSGLLDKYLLSQLKKESLVFLIPLVPIVWIFGQDNGAGRLETVHGILWWLTKSGIVLLVCGMPLLLAALVKRLRR
jgi:hypothetical protein